MRAEQVGRALADAASARVRQLVAELARQGKQRADTRLAAPYDGVITSSHAEPGHVVAAGQRMAQLARTGALEAATSVPENALDALRSARSPAIRLWSLAGKVYAGKLRELAAAADRAVIVSGWRPGNGSSRPAYTRSQRVRKCA